MDEHDDVVPAQAALADMGDHAGGAFSRVDRVEHDALVASEQPHRLVAGLLGTP